MSPRAYAGPASQTVRVPLFVRFVFVKATRTVRTTRKCLHARSRSYRTSSSTSPRACETSLETALVGAAAAVVAVAVTIGVVAARAAAVALAAQEPAVLVALGLLTAVRHATLATAGERAALRVAHAGAIARAATAVRQAAVAIDALAAAVVAVRGVGEHRHGNHREASDGQHCRLHQTKSSTHHLSPQLACDSFRQWEWPATSLDVPDKSR